jgi:predicted alpha/beta-hydrolase family hydrolase
MTPGLDLLLDGPAPGSAGGSAEASEASEAPPTLALAHGAGAPMDTAFMAAFAGGLAAEGIRVARFEFPYMAARRSDGRKRPPDREPVLLEAWRRVIAALGPENLAIGGKSLGAIKTPTLIVQGTRDPLGSASEVSGYGLSPAIRLHWAEDGDHGLAPRKASGRTTEQNWAEAIQAIAAFLGGRGAAP